MEYFHNVIIKGNLTMTKATIQQSTICKFKHYSWRYAEFCWHL